MVASVTDRDLGYKAIIEKLSQGASVRVGVQGSDAAVTPEGSKLNLVQIATVHEFGSSDGRVPQRSFLRSTFDEKISDLENLVTKLIQKAAKKPDSFSAEKIVGLLGLRYLDLVKAKIRSKIEPGLSKYTLAKRLKERGDANPTPLIDTGRLIGSLTVVTKVGK